MTRQIVIGTRQSQLATWQAEHIASLLHQRHPEIEVTLKFFVTHGDRVLDKPLPEIGGKGVFTAELESALRTGEIDLAVHSLKDLPTDMADDFVIGAVPIRASPYDALISRSGHKLMALPKGATVGTSSLRRIAQLKAVRPDLNVVSLRGNVPTRISKARAADGPYDAIVLAVAGLDRLGMSAEITETLSPDIMLPAPAQGALAVQCRVDDVEMHAILDPIDHWETWIAVEAERAFLQELDSGCRLPVAALARIAGETIWMTGRVASLSGDQVITVQDKAPLTDMEQMEHILGFGALVAGLALQRGAGQLLAAIQEGGAA